MDTLHHKTAVEHERNLPVSERIPDVNLTVSSSATPCFSQKNIQSMCLQNSHDAFLKLTRTAYELALNPALPLSQFETLVKVQPMNGVRLVQGKYYSVQTLNKL